MRIFVLSFLALLSISSLAYAHSREAASYSTSEDSAPMTTRIPKAKNTLLGLRAGQGDAFEGKLSMGLNFEYLYSPNFGFALQAHHAAYATEISAGPMQMEVKNRAITVAALGNFHPEFIHVSMLDPFLSVGVAHSFVKTKATFSEAGPSGSVPSPDGISPPATPPVTASGDSTFLVASLNARYFLDRNLSVLGSLGLGLSTLTVGMDYLF